MAKITDRPRTYFLDIDGCLLKHRGSQTELIINESQAEVLPGVLAALKRIDENGGMVILTTGRKECLRDLTEKQLLKLGIFYDRLIMNVTSGVRVLVNDIKPQWPDEPTAIAINLIRDTGLEGIKL